MASLPNRSPKFRAMLKREVPAWVQEGILTDDGAERLNARYQLDHLGKESSRLLAAVLFTIGGLLLGGGVISFVTAHWEEIPVSVKVALLLAVLLAFHLTGYWLRYARGSPRLGHALIFCGCLVFGANIGLFAQIFHVSGDWYRAFGAWAIGSLAMAWAARSWLTGVLVLATSFTWFVGFAADHHERLAAIYPFLLAATLLSLAWMIRSRVLETLTFLGVISALAILAGIEANSSRSVLLAAIAGGFLAWAVGEFHRTTGVREEFGNPVASLGIVALAVGAYVWSFRSMWKWDRGDWHGGASWLIPVGAAIVIGTALSAKAWPLMSRAQRRLSLSIVLASLILSGCPVLSQMSRSSVALPTIGANLAALIFAATGLGRGIVEERRADFWFGSLLLVLLITSRFLEYDTSLLLKSAAFIIGGAAVMLAGIAYERFLRRKEAVAP